jgi:formylglycine-generating enzyme required for sulfatase activity
MRRTGFPLALLSAAWLAVGCGGSRVTDGADQDGSYQPEGDPVVSRVDLAGGVTMEFVWLGPGYFTMGSASSEDGRYANEGPRHRVTLSHGFYIARYELTQGQWEAVMNTRPWAEAEYVIDHPDRPAVYISWDDVQRFVGKLNETGSARFRLPTEAEWEYACRAGAGSAWWFGDEEAELVDHAWYRANAWDYGFQYGQQVGMMPANPWGLHDLHGNIQEWVLDWYGSYASAAGTDPTGPAQGTARVVRGGSVDDTARSTRSAYRSGTSPEARGYFLGARLVLED